MELQQIQNKMIDGLSTLKDYLIKKEAPTHFINLINDCSQYISVPIPVATLTQEDFMPLENTLKEKTAVNISINNSTIIMPSKVITDCLAIPPSFSERHEDNSNGGI